MSNLTLKTNKEEDIKIEELKIYYGIKTSNGAIRKLISEHLEIDKERKKLKNDKARLKDDRKKLKNSINKYFDSMHYLMKISEYEQKL